MKVVAYNCEICDLYKEGYVAKEKHENRPEIQPMPHFLSYFPSGLCLNLRHIFPQFAWRHYIGYPYSFSSQGCAMNSLLLDLMTSLSLGNLKSREESHNVTI